VYADVEVSQIVFVWHCTYTRDRFCNQPLGLLNDPLWQGHVDDVATRESRQNLPSSDDAGTVAVHVPVDSQAPDANDITRSDAGEFDQTSPLVSRLKISRKTLCRACQMRMEGIHVQIERSRDRGAVEAF